MAKNLQYQSSTFQQESADDEIDLRELFSALWKGKWTIVVCTFVFAVGGVAFALLQANTYKAEAILASTDDSGGGGLAAMAGQLGGLASLAGVNLGGGDASGKVMALATLKSRQFVNYFINKHDLLVPLMASTKWIEDDNRLVINPDLYNETKRTWLIDEDTGESLKPTDWDAYKAFKKLIAVADDKETGLVTLSITHYSPIIAKQWVDWLTADLNAWMKKKSLEETSKNIKYLNKQIYRTRVSEMQTVFYGLIQEQTKALMLAEVNDEFSFKIIDPAVIPEEKAGPKRALICVLAVLLGGMLGTGIVLVRFVFKKEEDHEPNNPKLSATNL